MSPDFRNPSIITSLFNKMNKKKLFKLFDEKSQELFKSSFSRNLSENEVTIGWNKDKGLTNLRKGPNYESIKNFVITFRNFTLDSDPISISNIAKMYNALPNGNDFKDRFQDVRKEFNNYLDALTIIEYNGEKLSNRKLINTYIYGDVIHLEKHDEFKRWISVEPMKDVIFSEIVYILGICGNFIYYFNNLNKEYSSANPNE